MPEISEETLAQLVAAAVRAAMQQTTQAQQPQSQSTRSRQVTASLTNGLQHSSGDDATDWHDWHKLHLAQARVLGCPEELTAAEGR